MQHYENFVANAKRLHYANIQLATMIAVWAMGLIPAYFAVIGLMDIAGFKGNDAYTMAIVWFFAIILEVVGVATLKLATESFVKWYAPDGLRIDPKVPIACAAAYIVNMMLLTTLHNILPESAKVASVGLLCLMPVIANVVGGMRSVQDVVEIAATKRQDEDRRLAEEDRKRRHAIEDAERQAKIERENIAHQQKLELAKLYALAKIDRSTHRSRIVPNGTIPTEERPRNDDFGTILERIGTNGYTSAGSLSKDTGIPKTTVYRILSDLTEAGKLHRVEGEGKVSYELNGYH